MSFKIGVLSCLILIVIGAAGYGIFKYSKPKDNNSKMISSSSEQRSVAEEANKYVEVGSTKVTVSPVDFSNNKAIVSAGYIAPIQLSLNSSKKMSKVSIENLKVNNQGPKGNCSISNKIMGVGKFKVGIRQTGSVGFKLTCHIGVTYTKKSVSQATGSFQESRLLSYGGLKPANLSKSIRFIVVVKFDDGTTTKKTFTSNINGWNLFRGNLSAGTISGEGDKF